MVENKRNKEQRFLSVFAMVTDELVENRQKSKRQPAYSGGTRAVSQEYHGELPS